MKVFLLEDDPTRVTYFTLRLLPKHHITHAWDCESGLKYFTPHHDVIFLDHDLGGRQMDLSHPDNGAHFATLISERVLRRTHVIVHSHNPEGARTIAQILSPAWLAPFGSPMFDALITRYLHV